MAEGNGEVASVQASAAGFNQRAAGSSLDLVPERVNMLPLDPVAEQLLTEFLSRSADRERKTAA